MLDSPSYYLLYCNKQALSGRNLGWYATKSVINARGRVNLNT